MTEAGAPTDIAEYWREFARKELRESSPTYERLALAIADDPFALEFLAELPPVKRQPNLLLTVLRIDGVALDDPPAVCAHLAAYTDRIRATVLARATQTNEPQRIALVLPEILRTAGPIALIEVGASAGLCLHPDRYAISYSDGLVVGDPDADVRFEVEVRGARPTGDHALEIGWRAGIDLNPLDLADPDDVAWLEALVWPEHTARAARLHAAIAVAKEHPVEIVAGDLVDEIGPLLDRVPAGLRPVVFHTAVLGYLPTDRRRRFAEIMEARPDVLWLSNEGPGMVRHEDGAIDVGRPKPDSPSWASHPAPFVLVRNGTDPIALTQPHGEWIEFV